jgi:hypothetical protein
VAEPAAAAAGENLPDLTVPERRFLDQEQPEGWPFIGPEWGAAVFYDVVDAVDGVGNAVVAVEQADERSIQGWHWAFLQKIKIGQAR